MVRANVREGVQLPPRATNRLAASITVTLLSGSLLAGAKASSARAHCCRSYVLESRQPSLSNVKMPNVVKITRMGLRCKSSTSTLATRTRLPANRGKRWLAGSRRICSNLLLARRCRVSFWSSKNVREEIPITHPLHAELLKMPAAAHPRSADGLDVRWNQSALTSSATSIS